MNIFPFIPKEISGVPDQYGIKIQYLTGKIDEFEIVNHSINNNLLSLMTKEEIICWIPVNSIIKVEFDKRFTKLIELKSQNDQRQKNTSSGI